MRSYFQSDVFAARKDFGDRLTLAGPLDEIKAMINQVGATLAQQIPHQVLRWLQKMARCMPQLSCLSAQGDDSAAPRGRECTELVG